MLKRSIYWAVLSLLLTINMPPLQASSGNPPDGRTGAPGEMSCQACHEFGPGNGNLQISGPATYAAGQTYSISIQLNDPDQLRWGFQLTALDSANNGTGAFSITDQSNTQLSDSSDRDYVKHTSNGTYDDTPNGPVNWSVDWTAPASITGPITFYASGNAANSNNATSGDYIYTTSLSVDPEAEPTSTPPPEMTPTPSPTSNVPTNTPGACSETGVTLGMPANTFRPGDICFLTADVCNATDQTLDGYPLFVILDVFGVYYFAPSWIASTEGIDFYSSTFPVGSTSVSVIPTFNWPSGVGAAQGLIFYGAMTNPSISELFGTMSQWEMSWTE